MDWERLRHFVAVAEHGSLSAAARAGGISQPTLGRAISRLEEDVGQTLFRRHARGLVPTAGGEALLVHARAMRDAAARFALEAAGGETAERATVRITGSEIVATYVLPAMLAEIGIAHPNIALEIVASDANQNLLFRDADIAVRMADPDQNELVAKRVATLELGAYASHDYCARHGRPAKLEDLANHRLIGGDRSPLVLEGARALGHEIEREDFALRCDGQVVAFELVRAGCGLGFLPRAVADHDPGLVRLLPEVALPSLPVWLAAHRGLRLEGAVRTVFDALAAGLKRRLGSMSSGRTAARR